MVWDPGANHSRDPIPRRLGMLKIIAESAKTVLALFAESANVSLLPLSDTNNKPTTKMKTPIDINNIRETEKYTAFPYIIEVSAWDDCGELERWGAETEAEAREILDEEIEATIKWAAEVVDDFDPETTTIPEIAQILVRPEPDEDGDYDDLSSWEVL